MKNLIKLTACILLTCFAFSHVEAQELASLSTGGYPEAKAVNDKPSAPAEPGPVIHITLKNNCGKSLRFFVGSKADLKEPNIQTCGGMSKNTFTIPSTDIVCLMKEDNKPLSCAFLKPTTTICEINDTGNNISCK